MCSSCGVSGFSGGGVPAESARIGTHNVSKISGEMKIMSFLPKLYQQLSHDHPLKAACITCRSSCSLWSNAVVFA